MMNDLSSTPGPQYYKQPKFDTLQLHAGQIVDSDHRARAVPIYSTAGFSFKDSEHAAAVLHLQIPSHIYSRVSNPTVSVFQDRMAALEGGRYSVATASGQSAIFLAVANIAQVGDNIVSSPYLYGGTLVQLQGAFERCGINVRFVPSYDPKDFKAAIDENTKAIFLESIANPSFIVHDLETIAKVAHDSKMLLIVDNTLGMGGYLVRPFDHGADVVVHSATKWIGGHGTTIGGVIIDSGKFDWVASGRYPGLTAPSISSGGVIYSEKYGPAAFSAKLREEMLRDFGPCLNPFGAFLLLQGLETLSLRAERHCTNTMALAKWLLAHPKVAWVSYLGLESHPTHEIATKYMRHGLYGGMLCFGIAGGVESGFKLLDNLKLVSYLANCGDAKTLILYPANPLEFAAPADKEPRVSGFPPDSIRLSVGLEAIDDIIADFEGALAAVFPEKVNEAEHSTVFEIN